MKKRVIAGLLALTYIILSIPTSYAEVAPTVTHKQIYDITQRWLTNLYTACYSTENDYKNFTPDLIKVVNLGGAKNEYITLLPFSPNSEIDKISFTHTQLNDGATAKTSWSWGFTDTVQSRDSETGYKSSLLSWVGGDDTSVYYSGPTKETVQYASIGVIRDDIKAGKSNFPVTHPVYAWCYDPKASISGAGENNLEHPEYGMSLFYVNNMAGKHSTTGNSVDTLSENYGVDPMALMVFVAKIHVLYHNEQIWEGLGMKDNFKTMQQYLHQEGKATIIEDSSSTFKTPCTDADCPCLNMLAIQSAKGWKNRVRGDNREMYPMSSIYEGNYFTSGLYTEYKAGAIEHIMLSIASITMDLKEESNRTRRATKILHSATADKTGLTQKMQGLLADAIKPDAQGPAALVLYYKNLTGDGLALDTVDARMSKYITELFCALNFMGAEDDNDFRLENIKTILGPDKNTNSIKEDWRVWGEVLQMMSNIPTSGMNKGKQTTRTFVNNAVITQDGGVLNSVILNMNAMIAVINSRKEIDKLVEKTYETRYANIDALGRSAFIKTLQGWYPGVDWTADDSIKQLTSYLLGERDDPNSSNYLKVMEFKLLSKHSYSSTDAFILGSDKREELFRLMMTCIVSNEEGKLIVYNATVNESNMLVDGAMVTTDCRPSTIDALTESLYTIAQKSSDTTKIYFNHMKAIKEEEAKVRGVKLPRGKIWSNPYFGDMNKEAMNTFVLKGKLNSLLSVYEIKKQQASNTGADLGHLTTVKERFEVLLFCSQYGITVDADKRIQTVIDDTVGASREPYIRHTILVNNNTNYLTTHEYYYYMLSILTECDKSTIELLLRFNDFLSKAKGLNTNTLSTFIDLVVNIVRVLDYVADTDYYEIWYSAKGEPTLENVETLGEVQQYEESVSLCRVYEQLILAGLLTVDDYTIDIYDDSNPITNFWSVSYSNITFNPRYLEGRSLTSTYIPMQTNLYDPYVLLDYMSIDWIESFQYKYGFHRKALYIDTNTAAAVDTYVSSTYGNKRVATLGDLLQPEKDIVLYADISFYNVHVLAELQGRAITSLDNQAGAASSESVFGQLWSSVMSYFQDVDFPTLMKSGNTLQYSPTVANKDNISDMTVVFDEGTELKHYDGWLLEPASIRDYMNRTEYTEMMGFALVSNIYRSWEDFNEVNKASAANVPVFVSSPNLPALEGVGEEQKTVLYNYALLKNLNAMMTVGYETSLDLDSPIYTDIYGNIVTESGIVVVPAAANATLHESDDLIKYTPLNVAFLSSYGKSWSIPLTYNIDAGWMSQFFVANEETGVWDIKPQSIFGVDVNFAQLSYSDKGVLEAIMHMYDFDIKNTNLVKQQNTLNVLHETLRGAPIENIDMDREGLNAVRRIDKTGLIASAKLDSIINSIDWSDKNSIMNIPSLSFMDNYQYIVVFVFKMLLVIIVVALMITVYIDVVKKGMSWRTLLKCLTTLLVGVGSVLLIPTMFELTYYQSNKLLLQDEAEYILLLNTEKGMSGQEIGVYTVTEPEVNTEIYIKLDDYSFDWIRRLPDVIFGDSINVLNDEFEKYQRNNPMSGKTGFTVMNDGIYANVKDIFDTSLLTFSPITRNLYQTVTVDPIGSFYLPYYYFLDALLYNINDFNRNNNVYAYSTKIMRGGNVKTVNLCSTYFNDPVFMEEYADILGLHQLYGFESSIYVDSLFDEASIQAARGSQWYIGPGVLSQTDMETRINKMMEYCCTYISKNRHLIGKVTDETFLKVMAMSCSMYYNNLFGMPNATAYEIYNLSNADLMRLVVADKETTLYDSPMSFARFVYNEAGTPGVFAAAFLVIITLFVSYAKTIITIAVMFLLIVSVYLFQILLRQKNKAIGGYLLTLGAICGTNILYAIVLKLSLYVPQTGLAPTLCIIVQILLQLAYLALLGVVLAYSIRDWRNMGYNSFKALQQKITDRIHRRGKPMTAEERYDSKPRGEDGWKYYHRMNQRGAKRRKKVGN